MMPQNSCTRSPGSCSRPVSSRKHGARSGCVNSSPMIAMSSTRQDAQERAADQVGEVIAALERLAHRDELVDAHSAASTLRGAGREK